MTLWSSNLCLLLAIVSSVAWGHILEGTYYINSCWRDAPCCLEGYIGVTKEGTLSFNLAGFETECTRSLMRGFDECLGRVYEGVEGAYFGEISIPGENDDETQHFELTFMEETVQMRNVGGDTARRLVASAVGVKMATLEDGVNEGTVRHPDEHAKIREEIARSKGLSLPVVGAVAFFATVLSLMGVYAVGGVVVSRRNGGTWDGPFEHPHQELFKSIFSSRSSSPSDGAVLARASASAIVVAVNDHEAAEGGMMDVPLTPDLSGSPSKARRPKRPDWAFLRAIPMGDIQQSAANGPTSAQQRPASPRAISSPMDHLQRRTSVTFRAEPTGENRAEFV